MFLEDLCIEYSKTNRATCGQCRDKIQFEELRIGEELLVDEDEKPVVSWTHLRCFYVWRKYRDVDAVLIKGYNQLSSEHQRITKLFFEIGEKSHSFKVLPQTKQEKKKQHKSTEKTRRKDLVLLGYSYSQFEKYLNLVDSLEHKSKDQLRKMLEINFQSVAGGKETLVHRCADGVLFGAIQKCPACKHQNMDYNFTDGFFVCLGKQPKACGMKYGSDLITRTPWMKEDLRCSEKKE